MKRLMNFLFGKKPAIYDSQGKINHRWAGFMERWRERYRSGEALNWRNHSGLHFVSGEKEDKKPKKSSAAA